MMDLVTLIVEEQEITEAVELAETIAGRYPDQDTQRLLQLLQALQGDILRGGGAWGPDCQTDEDF